MICRISNLQRQKESPFIIHELIQISNQYIWLWICIEPLHRSVQEYIYENREKYLLLKDSSDHYLRNLKNILFKMMIYRYYEAYIILNSNIIHLSHQKKSLRVNQYSKDKKRILILYSYIKKRKIDVIIYFMQITSYNSLFSYI